MGNSGGREAKKLQDDSDSQIINTFGKNELALLRSLYDDLARRDEEPTIDKATFLEFFSVPLLLGERLFKVFDWKNTGVIDLDEFLGGLAKYAGGTTDTRMEMLFHIYDLNEEKSVNKEELRMMLFSLVAPQAGLQSEAVIPDDSEEVEEEIQPAYKSDPSIGAPQKQSTLRAPLRQSMPSMSGDSLQSIGSGIREEPIDIRKAITQMVDDAFEECDLDRSSKLTLDQWKLFVNKNPALMENLEYVLLGSVWEFIHPESIGMGQNMAEMDELNMGLLAQEDTGLRLQLVAEELRRVYYCKDNQLEVWHGGPPTELNSDPNVTQISITVHGDGPLHDQEIKFCPYTGKPLEFIEDTMKEKVQIENLNLAKKKRRKIFMQGYLYIKKRGKKMERRYYVINGPFLYVFPNNDTSVAFEEASYILGYYVEPTATTKGPHGKMYGISLIPPAGSRNHPLTVYSVNERLRTEWISALRKAARTGKIEDVYNLLEKIGRGQFSVVHKARHVDTGDWVAVKNINKKKLDAREKEAIQNEIAICQLVSHPNVIRLKEVFENKHSIYLVMPLLQGDLFSHLKANKRLDENTSKRITWKLLDALKYLHALGIVHRDLKPENILMNDPDNDPTNIMIADFGLSKFAMPHERLQLACGTVAYVAPEVLRLRGYDKSCDLWSVGIILYLCLRGRLPFDAPKKTEIIKMTMSRPANLADPYWRKISNAPKNLISKLLKKNPDNRIPLETAMAHVWFDDVREELAVLSRRQTGKMLTQQTSPAITPHAVENDAEPPPAYESLVKMNVEEVAEENAD